MFRGLEQSRKVGNHESRKMNKKTERHIKSHFGSKIDAKMLLDQQTQSFIVCCPSIRVGCRMIVEFTL